MKLDAVADQIAEDAAHLDAAHHRLLANIRLFAADGDWHLQGFRTCAQWLSWRVGWTPGTAREHVRVAIALGNLPEIDRALGRGELSYCKVRALTRVATPTNEHVLLEQARLTTGHQLEQICRKYASVQRHDAAATRPEDDRERRYVRRRDTEDGMVLVEAALHPDEAALVWAALEQISSERCRARASTEPSADRAVVAVAAAGTTAVLDDRRVPSDVSAGMTAHVAADHDRQSMSTSVSAGMSGEASSNAAGHAVARDVPAGTSRAGARRTAFDRADALVQMAQAVVRGETPDRSPTEIMISIPLETLQDLDPPDATQIACCADGTGLSCHAARRLACDAGIIAMLDDANGGVLAAGRKRRTIPGAMKRALLRRDRTCRFPGCQTRVFLEGHHVEHWVDGGATDLSNMLALCGHHHRFVHEHGFTIALRADGTVVAHDPHGRAVPEIVRSPAPQLLDLGWPNITRRNERLGITAETIECWDGTPVDYPELVDWIVRTDERAAHRSP